MTGKNRDSRDIALSTQGLLPGKAQVTYTDLLYMVLAGRLLRA